MSIGVGEIPPTNESFRPTREELEQVFFLRHGSAEGLGWWHQRNLRYGFFRPDCYYQTVLRKCVTPGCAWIDIGGGKSMIPGNEPLARQLAENCSLVVGVDPSDNIQRNPFVHEYGQCLIEDYQTDHQFDVATMMMVAEHVIDPVRVIGAVHKLLRPGGRMIVLTVNFWSPITIVSRVVPDNLHYRIKKLIWPRSKPEDTFPTAYKMNTHRTLTRLFRDGGFREIAFLHLDDMTFGYFKTLNYLETTAWRALRAMGMRYPENCLLGVYERE